MSMTTMTSRERIGRMFDHHEADRVPITDTPWASTLERWRREGLGADQSIEDYFDLDQVVSIPADNSPRYPVRTIEETDDWVVHTTKWGAKTRNFKHRGHVPEFLDHTVVDADTWREAKRRITPDRDRIDWAGLERNYDRWREQGAWIQAGFWFGFDVTHSWFVGTERVLMALAEGLDWVVDIFNHMLDVDIALFEMVWDAGYHFDAIHWPDDMGYKQAQFFSLPMYRELLRPVHARAARWAKAKGLKVHLHSCGDIRPFIDDLIEISIDMLNPLEVKAGMDPIALKRRYRDRLAFHGGLNAVLYNDMEKLEAEMRRTIPAMKEGGGYWISSDHSVPDSVSLEQFGRFVRLAKELGAYR